MRHLNAIEKQSKSLKFFLGLVLIGIVGVLEFLTGYEIEFSLFYVIPVSFVTWFTNRSLGVIASLVSAVVWLGTDAASGHSYPQLFAPLWNTFIRLSFFVIIALLLSALRRAMEHEAQSARTDSLTGAVYSRAFYELLRREIDRLERYGRFFTLVYIDLDNFKAVNDQFGHVAGDQALWSVADFIRGHIRRTDIAARLGGDEFAVLLPETHQEVARVAVSSLRLGLLEEMRQKQWPVTFSIGVLTCQAAAPAVDALARMADELMYAVKREGKNGVNSSVYAGG